MIKKLIRILGLAAIAGPVFAQSPLSSTTLSGVLTSYTNQVCLASATNVVVPSLASGTIGSILLVDNEAMQVVAQGATSTCFMVRRGAYATNQVSAAAAHGNGQKVWVMGATLTSGDPSRPFSSTEFLAALPYQPFEVVATPSLYGVALASKTATAGTIYYGAIEVDDNTLATGACLLNAATQAGNVIYALYDNTGTLLANTTTAGTAASGASAYQCVAFTSPIALLGPKEYFIGVQSSNATNTFDVYTTGGAHTSYPTGSVTGVFGTLTNFASVPTTFTASVGPAMTLY
jgi:hypothetical protein